jgi:hypothetical protein
MGLVYNGVANGNTPDSILITFLQGEYGVGAYIQADAFGPFSATISLFDISDKLLGSFTASGVADNNVGTALFIGAATGDAPVYFATFSATGDGSSGAEPNFAIGTMQVETTPEPASLFLLTPVLLGMVAFTRRRKG